VQAPESGAFKWAYGSVREQVRGLSRFPCRRWGRQIHRRQAGLVACEGERPAFLFRDMEGPKETIVAKAYDLLKAAIPMLEGLPRKHKFTLGDRLQNHLSDVLESLIEAVYLPPAEKKPVLRRVNLTLEKIRFYLRLGYDLGLYNSGRYKDFTDRVDEIGRMTGGWLKSL
jgi:hypothetical protein